MSQTMKVLIPLVVAAIIWLLPVPQGLTPQAMTYVAIFAAVVLALIFEPIPSAAVGLVAVVLVSVLMLIPGAQGKPQTGAGMARWALAGLGNPTVVLIFAAYLLAMGYEKTGLGRRVAMHLMRLFGRRALGLAYAAALADCTLAPFIPSNTARSGGLIFPIIKSIPPMYGSTPDHEPRKIGSFLMWLGICTAGVTSSMFLTGGSFNLLAASIARDSFNVNVTWGGWFLAFLPMGIIIFALNPILAMIVYPPAQKEFPEVPQWAAEQLSKLGPMTRREFFMAFLSCTALMMWVFASKVKIDPSITGLMVVVCMVLTGVVTWDDVISNKQAWNVYIWFATLLTMAGGLAQVGFLKWLSQYFTVLLGGYSMTVVMVGLLAFFFFTHYFFASLIAHVTAILPICLTAAAAVPGLNMAHFFYLCGGMLGIMGVLTPYASGPNPIFFGANYVPSKDFWSVGAIYGVIYFVIVVAVGIPYLRVIM